MDEAGTASTTLTQPTQLVANASVQGIIGCNGGTVQVGATASGGTPNYTGTGTFTVSAGSYSYIVTDANGCTAVASGQIGQPSVLAVSATAAAVSCNGGSNGTVNLTVAGGTPSYSYTWSNGSANANLSGLAAGTYTATVTDANGCSKTASATVTQPTALLINRTVSNITCNGAANGSIVVTANGGTPAYSYLWNNGATTKDRSGLGTGTFTVTVTDANGCSATTSATITAPSKINVTKSSTTVTCFGGNNGTATIVATGGTPSYSYLWNNGQTTATATGLTAGNYTATVTDANGCTKTTGVSVAQNPNMIVSFTNVVAGCGLATAKANIVGGTQPYTYLWSNGVTLAQITM